MICTKDRPGEIEMSCAAAHSASPLMPILVVDASATQATRRACERLSLAHGSALRLIYRRAKRPGLTRQRNEAVDICRDLGAELVHFIDDDTEVSREYFAAIERRFRRDPEVMGVGGVIVNQPVIDFLPIRRLFLLRSGRRGSVLRSGRNMLGQYPGTRATDRVDWLSGCSMSYRLAVFDELRFDVRREGACLGEDYDFGFRLSRRHRLGVEPAARCIHHLTPTARISLRARARESTETTHRWVAENRVLGLSYVAFWWATLGDLGLHAASWIVRGEADSLEEMLGVLGAVRRIALSYVQPGAASYRRGS